MRSRGFLFDVGARARRGFALFGTALIVATLLLQYVALVAPAKVLAVHDDGLFELDGNSANDATAGDDWDGHPGATGSRFIFVSDPLSQTTDEIFTGGSTKDAIDLPSWRWTVGSVPDKDNIEHAYAASYTNAAGHNIVYFGLDRYATNGDAFVGFWFYKNGIGKAAGGTFTGTHAAGDLLVLADFTNGGSVPTIKLYEWVGSGGSDGAINLLASGQECTGAPVTDKACAQSNSTAFQPGWTFDDKGANGTDNPIPPGGFFEGGIDLTDLYGGDAPCFSGFLGETRSSQSVDAVLKDFALGNFNTCEPPAITTHVQQNGQNLGSLGTINKGESVTDHAAFTGTNGAVTGTAKFFVCRDASTTPDCSTGGTQVGGTVAIANGAADSAAYTPTQLGTYCFRVEYTPDAAGGNHYVASSHTNQTTECFTVIPAEIALKKVADAGSVSAGSTIGFTLTVTSKGPGTAFGVKVSDTLPTNAGLGWAIDAAGSDSGWSINGGVLSFGGANGVTMAAAATSHVHITSPTTAATCGTVNNSGTATTTNDGTANDAASVVVNCPDIHVKKTADNSPISAGDTASYTITVSNDGAGTARNVTLSDLLPAGITWSDNNNACSIANGTLSCSFGDLAPGAKASVTVSGTTPGGVCADLPNTATAAATNESAADAADNSDSATIVVNCASIDILKTADKASVTAGDQIGFTITVVNNGKGNAYGVSAADTLDGAFTWSLSPASAGWTLVGNSLTYQAATLAPGASSSVHVVATTTAEDCRVVDNTATVSTTNDGSGKASASTEVLCPDIHVIKSADAGTISAGDTASFTIKVTNDGKGIARGVKLQDPLPAGVTWTDNSTACDVVAGALSCDFGDLAAGASASVTVSGATSAAVCGLLDNTAYGTAGNESKADAEDNSGSASITVLCPDVHVLKTAAKDTISAGDTANFTMTVTNDGKGIARDVTLSDPLPAGITWHDNSAACDIANGTLTCSFGDLAAGASASVEVSGVTDAADCSVLHNTASVAATNESEADATDNTSSASITVLCPDVKITKTAGNGTINAGDQASYTITVTNIGKGTARDVTVNDVLPSGVTWSADNTTDCSIDAGVLSCSFGDLAPDASASVTVSGDTDALDCGTLPNTATTAATNEPDDVLANNTDSATITVNCPAIVITKTADQPVVSAGDTIGFTVIVGNNGAGTAYGVTVDDPLPTTAGLDWSIDAANSTDGWSIVSGHLVYGPASLPAATVVYVHITSVTTAATCSTVDNTANLTYRGGTDSDEDSVMVECPDVHVDKTAANGTISAGDEASFTMTVTNDGKGIARNVTLNDPLPSGIEWSENSVYCSITDGTLSCDFGDMASGDVKSVTVTGTTSAAACGVLENTADVAATNESEADAKDNSDSASITVNCPNVTITKDAIKSPVLAGESAGFVITARNEGPGTAYGVVISDTLPAGLDWATSTKGCSIDAGVLTCQVGDLASGGSFSATVTATTTVKVCGRIPNTATVSATNEAAADTEDNSASAFVTVQCASISLVKTAGDAADGALLELTKPGNVVFTYVVTNTGTAALQDVTLVDDNATPANTADDITVVCPQLTLAAGESMTCHATLPVDYGLRTNIATVTANPVLKPTDEVSDTDDAVVKVPLPEVTPTPTPKPTPRPTPKLTPPPTSTLDPQVTENTASGLLLVLVAIAGLMLAVGLVAPGRAKARRRTPRS